MTMFIPGEPGERLLFWTHQGISLADLQALIAQWIASGLGGGGGGGLVLTPDPDHPGLYFFTTGDGTVVFPIGGGVGGTGGTGPRGPAGPAGSTSVDALTGVNDAMKAFLKSANLQVALVQLGGATSANPSFSGAMDVPTNGLQLDDTAGLIAALAAAGVQTQKMTWNGTAYVPVWSTTFALHEYWDGPNPLTVGVRSEEGTIWMRLNSPGPGPANTITIGSAVNELDGTDMARAPGQIIRYWRTVAQTVTPTNPSGIEVVVSLVTGLVVSRNDRVLSGSAVGTAIPVDTYVLSGEGKGAGTAGQWLLDNAPVGALVVLSMETIVDPPPDPPDPTSGLNALPILLYHGGSVATAPPIGSYPSTLINPPTVRPDFNTVVLTYAVSAAAGTGSLKYTEASGQTPAALRTSVTSYVSGGWDVLMSIGGGGGADGGIMLTTDANADQMVASIKTFVTDIGINGIDLDIQSANWNQASVLRLCTRLKADLGAGFIIGINPTSASWVTTMVTLATKFDFVNPGLWAVVEATDSRLTALTLAKIASLKAAGIPESKIIVGYCLGAPGSSGNTTPTTALVIAAWSAAKAAYPDLRGYSMFDDNIQVSRNWDFGEISDVVRGAVTGAITSFTAVPNGAAPTTALDLAWTYAGTDTVTGWTLTRSGGQGGVPVLIDSPASGTRVFADVGLTANTAYTYNLTAGLTAGGTATKTVTGHTQSVVTAPGPGTARLLGASCIGVANGSFGTWRGSAVTMMRTWFTTMGNYAKYPGKNAFHDGSSLIMTDKGPAEYYSWNQSGELSPGGVYRSVGDTWALAASGAYDTFWASGINTWKGNWNRITRGPLIVISPFHEMNGNWFDHSVRAGEQANFILAWRRFYNVSKANWPQAKIGFCNNGNTSGQSYRWDTTMWPGAAYVDYYEVDYYSNHWVATGSNVNSLSKDGFGAPYGLEAHRQFALAQGLPIALPEWGVNNSGPTNAQTGSATGDVPVMIQQISDWFRAHQGTGPGQVPFETFFNSQQQEAQFQFYPVTKSPVSAALYRQLW